jgi:hypothetical protein
LTDVCPFTGLSPEQKIQIRFLSKINKIMKLLTFIIAFSFICFCHVSGISADKTTVTKAIVLQAELKNNPTKVPVFCKVVYEGENTTEALIEQGNSVLIKQELRNGNNDIFFFAQANKNHEVASLKLIVND